MNRPTNELKCGGALTDGARTIRRGPTAGMTKHMPLHSPFRTPPGLSDIEDLANRELTRIPWELRRHLDNVAILVEEFPDEETEDEMDLESPFDILGLYRGVALPHRSLLDVQKATDMIFLYRRPILDYWCETGQDLGAVVRHVLIHEIGHHFGFSDEDMERIEND